MHSKYWFLPNHCYVTIIISQIAIWKFLLVTKQKERKSKRSGSINKLLLEVTKQTNNGTQTKNSWLYYTKTMQIKQTRTYQYFLINITLLLRHLEIKLVQLAQVINRIQSQKFQKSITKRNALLILVPTQHLQIHST